MRSVEGEIALNALPDVFVELDSTGELMVRFLPAGPVWSALASDRVATQVRESQGILLGVSTALDPERLESYNDLVLPWRNGEIMLGWVALA